MKSVQRGHKQLHIDHSRWGKNKSRPGQEALCWPHHSNEIKKCQTILPKENP